MLCKGLDEDVDHLLLHCQVASLHDCGWWGLIGLEWKGDAKYGEGGVAQLVIQEGGGEKSPRAWKVAPVAILWFIWK